MGSSNEAFWTMVIIANSSFIFKSEARLTSSSRFVFKHSLWWSSSSLLLSTWGSCSEWPDEWEDGWDLAGVEGAGLEESEWECCREQGGLEMDHDHKLSGRYWCPSHHGLEGDWFLETTALEPVRIVGYVKGHYTPKKVKYLYDIFSLVLATTHTLRMWRFRIWSSFVR